MDVLNVNLNAVVDVRGNEEGCGTGTEFDDVL